MLYSASGMTLQPFCIPFGFGEWAWCTPVTLRRFAREDRRIKVRGSCMIEDNLVPLRLCTLTV